MGRDKAGPSFLGKIRRKERRPREPARGLPQRTKMAQRPPDCRSIRFVGVPKLWRFTWRRTASIPLVFLFFLSMPFAQADVRNMGTDRAGADGNRYSYGAALSADGRHMAFESLTSNLVVDDRNGAADIFIKDTVAGDTRRVSTDGAGVESNGSSFDPVLSVNGRYVAFWSYASNLVAGDSNGSADIFIKDTVTGEIQRMSTDTDGVQGNGSSSDPAMSDDGRYVAFESSASNLVADDSNGAVDIFIRDVVTGETQRMSTDSAGGEADGDSYDPALSADGRYVAFRSSARNLMARGSNEAWNIFIKDRVTGETRRVSADSVGVEGNGHSYDPTLSADGYYVAFRSYATNLVSGDRNEASDIFIKDTVTGETRRVSTDSVGVEGNGHSHGPSLSADGRYVAFRSYATNLVAGDLNGSADIFIKDTVTGETRRVSTNSAAVEGNDDSHYPILSADARYVAFRSLASNLVAGDGNWTWDIFIKDCSTGETRRVGTDNVGR